MQRTAGWSNTNYSVVYGEKRLAGDANEGAMINVGTWRDGCAYIVCGFSEATPAAFAAIPWDNSFFKGVGASNSSWYTRPLIDYGAGEKNYGHGFTVFPGGKKIANVSPCVHIRGTGFTSSIGWDVNFLFDGTIQKQWQGFAAGNDSYLMILERNIL